MNITRKEAALIGAYTGFLIGPFNDMHAKIEEALDRPVLTHELASKSLWVGVRQKLKPEIEVLYAKLSEAPEA